MTKKLGIMFGIILLLTILVMIKNRPSYSDKTSADLLILPLDFDIIDVQKIEFYTGKNPNSLVTLSCNNGEWLVSSAFQTKGDNSKIQNFLDKLQNSATEIRYTSKKFWEDFNITDEQALHIKIYRKSKTSSEQNEPQPIYLLVGKSEEQTCFVRHADEENVLNVAFQIREEIGMYGSQEETVPESSYWIDKTILKIKPVDVVGLSIQYPDKKLAFAKKAELPTTTDPTIPTTPSDPNTPITPASTNSQTPTMVWHLVEGGIAGKELKKDEVTQLVESLQTIDILDSVDPQAKDKYGLQPPQFRMEILLADGTKNILCAGRPDLTKEGYCYLESDPQHVYKMASWRFENLFKLGSRWFDLVNYRPDISQIKTIELQSLEGKFILNRSEQQEKDQKQVIWTFAQPEYADQTVNKQTADTIVNMLQSWQMGDYTDEKDLSKLGFNPPEKILVVTLKDDSRHVFQFGKPALSMSGQYVTMDDIPIIGIMAQSNCARLFPSKNQIFSSAKDTQEHSDNGPKSSPQNSFKLPENLPFPPEEQITTPPVPPPVEPPKQPNDTTEPPTIIKPPVPPPVEPPKQPNTTEPPTITTPPVPPPVEPPTQPSDTK